MLVVFTEGEFGRAVAASLASNTSVREYPAVDSQGHFDVLIDGGKPDIGDSYLRYTRWRLEAASCEQVRRW